MKQADNTALAKLQGRLYLSRTGWILLQVPNALGRAAFQALNELGTELPKLETTGQYNAHISVIRPEELEMIGGAAKITERGKMFSYTTGQVRTIPVSDWPGISRVWMIRVHSPELEKLRKSYGLPPLPQKNGKPIGFHITFAVRRANVLRENELRKQSAVQEAEDRFFPEPQHKEKQARVRGIPDRQDYGDLERLQVGELLPYWLTRHLARRAGEHYDFRVGDPDRGLYSWSTRKDMPATGGKVMFHRQPVHSFDYGDWQGTLRKGYGAGEVRRYKKGQVLITSVSPDKIEFSIADARYPERFVLVKPKKFPGRQWLLINNTPRELIDYEKVSYTTIPAEQVENLLQQIEEGTSVQEKIDGAHVLVRLLRNSAEIVSHRKSATGKPIVHTERVFGKKLKHLEIPEELQDSVLLAELYGERDGKAIPPQELGGLLNATLQESLLRQKAKGTKLRMALFDVARLRGAPVTEMPYAEKKQLLQKILPHLPEGYFHLPEEAVTPEEAIALWRRIGSGEHPRTEEGVVIHPPQGRPLKAKHLDEQDVYIVDVFPGEGKYRDAAGGFTYAIKPGGPAIGRVGTGLSDELRRELWQNMEEYKGRTARVRSQGTFPSGALRAPVLLTVHEG